MKGKTNRLYRICPIGKRGSRTKFRGGAYKYFSGVYKYFSGAGEVYLNTTMAFFCPGKVLHKCRPIYKYFSGFSGAGEVYKYFSGMVYINTSPALPIYKYFSGTVYKHFSSFSDAVEVYNYFYGGIFKYFSGAIPTCYKDACVTPRLKQPTLPPCELFSYRPISNLSFPTNLL